MKFKAGDIINYQTTICYGHPYLVLQTMGDMIFYFYVNKESNAYCVGCAASCAFDTGAHIPFKYNFKDWVKL